MLDTFLMYRCRETVTLSARQFSRSKMIFLDPNLSYFNLGSGFASDMLSNVMLVAPLYLYVSSEKSIQSRRLKLYINY
jgi:hypothetical protein